MNLISQNNRLSQPRSHFAWFQVSVLVVVMLSIHLGYSEFISFQFAFFVCTLIYVIARLPNDSRIMGVALIILTIHLLATAFADHDFHYLLRAIRTSLVASIIYCFRCIFSKSNLSVAGIDTIEKVLFFVGVLSLLSACLQLFDSQFINVGLFDIPESWFSLDYGTQYASQRLSLSNSGYFIRPSGFFSEPSSLAFSSLIGFFCGHLLHSKRLTFVSVLVIVVSMSLSGVAILALLFLYFSIANDRNGIGLGKILLGITLVIAILGVAVFVFEERLSLIRTGDDVSSSIRLIEPFRILGIMLDRQQYFGLTAEVLERYMSEGVDRIFDNWIFNQFLLYGVFGILTVSCLFLVFPIRLIILILPASMINGDVFYYDRIIFFLVLLFVYEQSSRTAFLNKFKNI